jgi:AbiU2
MNDQTKKLEAEVEALQTLTIRAYQRFIFLRPMLANQELQNRINGEGKVRAFEQLRYWLYWGLVQQLSNICSDRDERSPSITTVTRKLKDDVNLRKQLEKKWVKNGATPADFDHTYSDYLQRAEEVLSSRSVGGYKKIRNKLVSHNALGRSPMSPTGYDFYNLKDANVTIGDERRLLETLEALVNSLLLIVKNVHSTLDSIVQQEEEVARKYWELSAPPDENKADPVI